MPDAWQRWSLRRSWLWEEGGPVSQALTANVDTGSTEWVWENGTRGGPGKEMPPVLAFVIDLLLNKHISGLRVKYIGLQQSGRPLRIDFSFWYKLFSYLQ